MKTGVDEDSSTVATSPIDVALTSLIAFPRPGSLAADHRFAPYERQVYRIRNMTLTRYKLETDGDYHLVISDGSNTLIAEIPSPDCVGPGSPFLQNIRNARTAFDSAFSATPVLQATSATATVMGVGFFDFFHGQTGIAPNAFELHPVTGICFGAGCELQSGDGGMPGRAASGADGCGCSSDVPPGAIALWAILILARDRPRYRRG